MSCLYHCHIQCSPANLLKIWSQNGNIYLAFLNLSLGHEKRFIYSSATTYILRYNIDLSYVIQLQRKQQNSRNERWEQSIKDCANPHQKEIDLGSHSICCRPYLTVTQGSWTQFLRLVCKKEYRKWLIVLPSFFRFLLDNMFPKGKICRFGWWIRHFRSF